MGKFIKMNIEIIIFLGIILLAIVSIFFGILNWVKLTSNSLKISIVEEEIEKKTKEFDSLKKERQVTIRQVSDPLVIKESADNLSHSSLITEPSNAPIQVVRNYPYGFQTVGIDNKQQSEVLDIIDENNANPPHNHIGNEAIEIILFSETKKDTDFISAWKTLSENLSAGNRPNFIINFQNVMFLYEKELTYLEKMYEIVMKAHGTIKLRHCHRELLLFLSTRPKLMKLFKEF
jgi:hypothetical protein